MKPIDVISKLRKLDLIDSDTALDNKFSDEVEALCKDDTYDDWDHLQRTIQEELLAGEEDGDLDEYQSQACRIFYHGTFSTGQKMMMNCGHS